MTWHEEDIRHDRALTKYVILFFGCLFGIPLFLGGVIFLLYKLNPMLPYVVGWILVGGSFMLFGSFIWHKIHSWRASVRKRYLDSHLAINEGTMVYCYGDGSFEFLSGEDQNRGLGLPKDELAESIDDLPQPKGAEIEKRILDLYESGVSLRRIPEHLPVKYNFVQSLVRFHRDKKQIEEHQRHEQQYRDGETNIPPPPPPSKVVVNRYMREQSKRNRRKAAS